MEAARASIAGLRLALRALSEAHVARTTGHGTSGFFLFASSFGTSPLSLSSLLFTSFIYHHTPFTHPVGGFPQHVQHRRRVSIHGVAVRTAQ